MREPNEWAEIELGTGVRLLLGWRKGRHGLEAAPVDLHRDVGQMMRAACQEQLYGFDDRRRRPYGGLPALESDEYLSLPLNEQEDDPREADEEADKGDAAAGLSEERVAAGRVVELVRDAFNDDDFLSREALLEGGWLFYIVVVELEDGGAIGFLRRYNPQRGFSTGRLLTHFQGSLKRFTDPAFNFDFAFDLVIAPDEIAVLNLTAFESVFSDIEAAVANVPTEVAELNAELAIALRSDAQAMLAQLCRDKPSLAKRLRRVTALGHLPSVTKRALRDALARHGFERNRFGNGRELELADRDDARVLFDILEELYYKTDFSGQHRRADRYSPLS